MEIRRRGAVALVFAALAAGTQARASGEESQFAVQPTQGIVAGFGGFGAQLNQHLYADITGAAKLDDVEQKVMRLHPQFVRVFFNTSEWTYPDRMASFVRTVQLAQRTQAQIDITWQGSSPSFALQNMPAFANVLADLLEKGGINRLWVTLFNEPNSTRITLAQYEEIYRLLDRELRSRGVRHRVQFMGGDLVGTTSPLGQPQDAWFAYLASHMGDLLDAWSVHVYWNFWDSGKIERRLANEVRTIYAGLPEEQRRPVYVTEFGVRGVTTFEGEPTTDPGLDVDGNPVAAGVTAAFQEAWFMLRASQLGFSGFVKWDCYRAKYDNGTQDYSTIGPAAEGWPLRPAYHLLRLLTAAATPGGHVVQVDARGTGPSQIVSAYLSPGGELTVFGLDTRGGAAGLPFDGTPVAYSISGLPAHKLFHLVMWNAKGDGTNVDIGFLDSGPNGIIQIAAPVSAVFALTNNPLGAFPA